MTESLKARDLTYSPYSKFRVGAALLDAASPTVVLGMTTCHIWCCLGVTGGLATWTLTIKPFSLKNSFGFLFLFLSFFSFV